MFITTPHDECIDPEDDVSSGRRIWRRFRQRMSSPTFHLLIAYGKDVEVLQTPEISDWIDLPHSRREDPWVVEVRLISPGWLNGSGGWKMESVREIWQGLEPGSKSEVLVFITELGGRYVDSDNRTEAAMLRYLTKIYPA